MLLYIFAILSTALALPSGCYIDEAVIDPKQYTGTPSLSYAAAEFECDAGTCNTIQVCGGVVRKPNAEIEPSTYLHFQSSELTQDQKKILFDTILQKINVDGDKTFYSLLSARCPDRSFLRIVNYGVDLESGSCDKGIFYAAEIQS